METNFLLIVGLHQFECIFDASESRPPLFSSSSSFFLPFSQVYGVADDENDVSPNTADPEAVKDTAGVLL